MNLLSCWFFLQYSTKTKTHKKARYFYCCCCPISKIAQKQAFSWTLAFSWTIYVCAHTHMYNIL